MTPSPPTHHPTDDVLARYAGGTLPHAFAVVVAAHLSFCGLCRQRITSLETVGGALLDTLPEVSVDDRMLDSIVARLDEPDPSPAIKPPAEPESDVAAVLPAPIRSLIPGRVADLKWRHPIPRLSYVSLPGVTPGVRQRLVRAKPGGALPQHTHTGEEMTIVLAGAYHDGISRFAAGDFSQADETLEHRPKAEPGEPCICYIVSDAPIRLSSAVGRLADPFIDI